MNTAVRTHWEGCWRVPDHHACAVALIESMQAKSTIEIRRTDLLNDKGEIAERDVLDEVVGENVDVHLEQLGDNGWWLGVYRADGSSVRVNLWTKGKRKNSPGARIYGQAEDECA